MNWVIKSIKDERSFQKWGVPSEFSSLNSFEDTGCITTGVYSIYERGALIDINLDVQSEKPLLVFFNGAQKRDVGLKLPIFSGLGVAPKGLVTRLSINDPCLYMSDDMNMAWYVGSKHYSLQNDIIPRIIDKIITVTNASSVIFVGGSAGGAASLFYARAYPNSFCITSNPQTNILDYHRPHVNRFLKNCFGVDNVSMVKNNPRLIGSHVLNIRKHYGGSVVNPTIYLQNLLDEHHVERHFKPFMKSLKVNIPDSVGTYQLNNNLLVHVGDWGKGHKSAPRDFWADMILKVVENQGEWFDMFKSGRAPEFL
ncbi:hypothetical protein DN062_02670 [Nitrincola tibetensis]|uniref:Alpha/beta hydrolase n=1 Tax=Nitrincola tibetensis TaxID=2219697 RepID=A0A364NQA3_9GAMM|nr:hypothetical protein [Nitrincola tibetensis]RAU19190.1 hypothetical protein DN062_02670 [Nitrincola tibetensis]